MGAWGTKNAFPGPRGLSNPAAGTKIAFPGPRGRSLLKNGTEIIDPGPEYLLKKKIAVLCQRLCVNEELPRQDQSDFHNRQITNKLQLTLPVPSGEVRRAGFGIKPRDCK